MRRRGAGSPRTRQTYSDAAEWSGGTILRDWLAPRVLELTYTAWDLDRPIRVWRTHQEWRSADAGRRHPPGENRDRQRLRSGAAESGRLASICQHAGAAHTEV